MYRAADCSLLEIRVRDIEKVLRSENGAHEADELAPAASFSVSQRAPGAARSRGKAGTAEPTQILVGLIPLQE